MDDTVRALTLTDEDRARADCYALIARLFYAPPGADMLQQLGGHGRAGDQDSPFTLELEPADPTAYELAFTELQRACRNADPEVIRQEYDDVFIGAGRAAVTPYTSGYAVPHAPDRHLLALRDHLAGWGLIRKESVFEVEDHVSAVCEVMRWLIEHDRPLEEQLEFFNDFVYTGVGTFCDAIEARVSTPFYRAVAGLARTFLKVERAGFDSHAGV